MADIRPFCMPKWGIEMTEGTLAAWMVQEGEPFTRGQVLCLIETAKITNEVEAEFDGVLARVLVAPGAEEPVGALLGVFAGAETPAAEVEAFIAAFKPAETGVAAKAGGGDEAPAPVAAPAKAPVKIATNRPISPEALRLAEAEGLDITDIGGTGRGGRITLQDIDQALKPATTLRPKGPAELIEDNLAVFASPLARRIAALHGIDLTGVTGTGRRGRIAKGDVLALVPAPAADSGRPVFGAAFVPVANQPTVVPFDRIRKVVAQRLTEAKQQIRTFTSRFRPRRMR